MFVRSFGKLYGWFVGIVAVCFISDTITLLLAKELLLAFTVCVGQSSSLFSMMMIDALKRCNPNEGCDLDFNSEV